MARIRTLKPECWQDEKVGALSRSARLLWIGLITQADDSGRLRAAPALLKAHLMPYDADATVEEIQEWLDEVERMGLVKCYRVGGERFAYLPRWSNHQRINRPTHSTIPAPSRENHGALHEPSMIPQRPDLGIKDQGSMDLTPDGRAGAGGFKAVRPKAAASAAARDDLWDSLVDALELDPQGITKNRRGKLNTALKQLREVGATPDEVKRRAKRYRREHPDWAFTETALASHWASLAPAKKRPAVVEDEPDVETVPPPPDLLRRLAGGTTTKEGHHNG